MSKFLNLHEDVMLKNDNQMSITFYCMYQGADYSRKISLIESVKKIPFQIMCQRQSGLFLFLSFLNSLLRDDGTDARFHKILENTFTTASSYFYHISTV